VRAHILRTLAEKNFKKCCISNELTDTGCNYLWDTDPDHMSSDDNDNKSV
jgi:hypothetical protein